jgi:hypothetical protein
MLNLKNYFKEWISLIYENEKAFKKPAYFIHMKWKICFKPLKKTKSYSFILNKFKKWFKKWVLNLRNILRNE